MGKNLKNNGKHWEFEPSLEKLTIIFPKFLRNKQWAEEFGDLYYFIKENHLTQIEINCEKTLWIDPVPLISLIILFNQYVSISKKNFFIRLPKVEKKQSFFTEQQSNIFLKFLFNEGFVNKLSDFATVTSQNEISNIEIFRKEVNKLNVILNYFDCHLLNARIYDACEIHEDEEEEVRFYSEIESIINEIRVNLINKQIPPYYFESMLYRIRLFFSETINNVFQYAYPGEEKKYFGIYARYRYGLQNDSIDNYNKKKLKKLLNQEQNNSSTLFKECKEMVFEMRDGCIEIFIVDAGIGITESSGYRNPIGKKVYKHPTRKAYIDILNTSQNRMDSDTKSHTQNGGLYVIGKHIEETHDFILFKDFEEWLGGILPDKRHNSFFDPIQSSTKYHTPGCIIQATLSWFPLERKIDNWTFLENGNTIDSIFDVYKTKDADANLLNRFIFIDERINYIPDIIGKKKYIKETINNKPTILNVIYLPHRGMTKHLMAFVILEEIAKYVIDNTTLIICDIPDEERIIYFEALNNTVYLKETKEIIEKIKKIILISNSLSICALINENGKFKFNNNLLKEFCSNKLETLNLSIILKALITHDSFLIWNGVKENTISDTFINNRVLWNNTEYIDEYLDFNQLCSFSTFYKLFLLGIQRVTGLFYPDEPKIIGLDLLVENLIYRVELSSKYLFKDNFKLFIGSVYVKGVTQNEALINFNPRTVFHCFQHPSLFEESIYKLFFWPKKQWIDNHFASSAINYKRIGLTHAIAPDGWEFFPVPRYLPKDDSSFYFISPKESYILWQNPQIGLRLGHFKYGNHFDLIKINIRAIVEKSFLEKGNLAKFLVGNFFYALGGVNFSQILDPDYRDFVKKLDLADFYKKNTTIVFPNHISNNYIIEKISEVLDDDLSNKIVPLNFIRKDNSKTNLLFSPLNFNKIKDHITNEINEIVFFDDAIVSGRTRKETKHLLFSFKGIKEVKTLSIFDRQRLPFVVPNPKTNKFFCRLDIPRLGVGNNNLLLNAINRALRTTQLIGSAKERIFEWEIKWGVNESFDNINILYPISIPAEKKKFSTKKIGDEYFQIGGDKNKILLTNSIGLTTYCLELFCVTGKDDLVIKYCKRAFNERAKIELICCHILLYGQELKESIRYKLFKELLSVTNYDQLDSYSSLAAITILTQEFDFIERLRKDNLVLNNCNKDIQIAFAVNTINSPSFILSDSYNNYISLVKEQSNQGLINISDFHRQIYEKRKSHISPLHAIVNRNRPEDLRISSLKVALEKLEWHCKKLFPLYRINNIENIIFKINECSSFVEEYQNSRNKRNSLVKIEKIVGEGLLPPLENIHKKLFFKITSKNNTPEYLINEIFKSIDWEPILKDKIKDDQYSVSPKFMISDAGHRILDEIKSDKILPLWIPYNESIGYYLKILITNYRHGSFVKISDPFSSTNLPLAQIWYTFYFSERDRKFSILFANSINSIEDFNRAKNTKHKKALNDFQLDIDLEYKIENSDILIAIMTFPII